MPAVEAEGLRKRYGPLVALDDFDLAVDAGEVIGVLGPNGAGKTTAIRILTTILQPDSGTFRIAGVDHTRPNEIRSRIGVLPESAGFPERQRADEYLRYHARLFGHTASSARVVAEALLREVGLEERSQSLVGTYSRGMRQRLGLARTLVNDPAVVFLDEPTLGLDPAGQRQILGLVRSIAAERGAAVLLCSHLLAEVEQNCSRVVILDRGRIAAHGTVAEIVQRAAAPRAVRVEVDPRSAEHALASLVACPTVDQARRNAEALDRIDVVLTPTAEPDAAFRDALRSLIDAGVAVRSAELEGARLSDAFLAMTEASR